MADSWEDFVELVQRPGTDDPFLGRFAVAATLHDRHGAISSWSGVALFDNEPNAGLLVRHDGPNEGLADVGVGSFDDGGVPDLLDNVWLSLARSHGTIAADRRSTAHEGALQGHVCEDEVDFRYALQAPDRDTFVVTLDRMLDAGGTAPVLEARYRRQP
jgi:hypothetical protein